MRTLISFLSVLLCVAPFGVANAVVSSTVGNNLTAYNGESGATNNNRWNTLMNSRSVSTGTAATADFGNCNAVIMRCAQPKCSNGGCTDMSVTAAIVSGCVQSNSACKQYGDELVQYISAQLIANSTAKANAAANQAQIAAANAAAQQSAQQMAAMQAQMQQMQADMAAQNAQTVAQLQSALDEQKQLTANAIAEATAARETAPIAQTAQPVQSNSDSGNNGLTGAQLAAAQSGVSADILAREQISGQIMSSIENAEVQLKTLKTTMNDVFNYAGCDSRGNNCTGPKRVKMFKQKAEAFFDPYESVLDELYDALILAQSVGVDITDIYMMLNGSCNVWGQYLCGLGADSRQQLVCDNISVKVVDGKSTEEKTCHYVTMNSLPTYAEDTCKNGTSVKGGNVRGGHDCAIGQIIPPEDDISCTLQKTIVDDPQNPVQRDWLWAETTDTGANIRVGCASSALETSKLFRNRKKQASIDIETLQKIIAQDEVPYVRNKGSLNTEQVKYCAVTERTYADLQKLVTTKTLPTKDLCIDERKLNNTLNQVLLINDASIIEQTESDCKARSGAVWSYVTYRCFCEKVNGSSDCDSAKSKQAMDEAHEKLCKTYGGKWSGGNCNCKDARYDDDKEQCEYRFNGEYGTVMAGKAITGQNTGYTKMFDGTSVLDNKKKQNEVYQMKTKELDTSGLSEELKTAVKVDNTTANFNNFIKGFNANMGYTN